jgi:hypothetical protein
MKKIKLNFFLFFIFIWVTSLFSCTKEKAPNLVDPNCVDTVSFSATVLPILQQNCFSCHGAGNTTGFVFSNHVNISSQSDAIIGAMQNQGFQLMPIGGPQLPDSTIQAIKCWIAQGKLNN